MDGVTRRVPAIPPAGPRVPVLIDTDAGAEVDDQHALALALCSPDRIDLRGIVAAHFGDSGGPEGIQRSHDEVQRVLSLAGLVGRVPTARGGHPLRYDSEPSRSDGLELILAEAKRATPEDPLWLVGLGPATDIVSAFLADPSIADQVVVLYHGRTRWPERCWNFNVHNDVRAARALFASRLPLVLFDTGTHLTLPMEEAEQLLGPLGPLGRYLVDIRRGNFHWSLPNKGLFDLGDITLLVDPAAAQWEEVGAPSVGWDLRYDHEHANGRMLRVHDIERDRTFALLAERLARWAGAGGQLAG